MAVNRVFNSVAGKPDTPQYWQTIRDQLRPLAQSPKAAPLLKADLQGTLVYITLRANTWAPKAAWEKNAANQAVASLGTRSLNELNSKCPGGRN